jgi:hypothetical protein
MHFVKVGKNVFWDFRQNLIETDFLKNELMFWPFLTLRHPVWRKPELSLDELSFDWQEEAVCLVGVALDGGRLGDAHVRGSEVEPQVTRLVVVKMLLQKKTKK